LSRKHDLFKNLKAYCSSEMHGGETSVFHITPLTFYVKVQPEKGTYLSIKQQMSAFKQVYSILEEFKGKFGGT
jgi:ssDNA-specific exonuclease RecJ